MPTIARAGTIGRNRLLTVLSATLLTVLLTGAAALAGCGGAEAGVGRAGIESWLGTYQWVEFAKGGPGSDQTIVHELKLTTPDTDGNLRGTFTEIGFQTDVSLDVVAQRGETGITVFAATDGPPFYSADQRLFALTGDPTAPTTDLGAVQALLGDPVPRSGVYFAR